MKIVCTGGGTGGHVYPVFAVIERLREVAEDEKIVSASIYYFSNSPYNKAVLFDNKVEFVYVPSGKMRLYFSFQNFIDIFKIFFGIIKAFFSLYRIYPDVVFAKGGFASFPTLFAARLLAIPVIIHESDSVPGRVNAWAGKFAKRIAVSYPEAAQFFKNKNVAVTGQPVRREILKAAREDMQGEHEYFHLSQDLPVILVLGGSQGAEIINETILSSLLELTEKYQIILQTGPKNFEEVSSRAKLHFKDNPSLERRFRAFRYLSSSDMRIAAGIADLIVSRAGSAIFEIAAWGVPSIIIPISDSQGDHQRENAFNYGRAGACLVVEEHNLTPHLLIAQIQVILGNPEKQEAMKEAAKAFFIPDAGVKIAKEIISIALTHEQDVA